MSRVLCIAMFVGRFPEMSETFILRQTARPLESGDKAVGALWLPKEEA